MEAAKFTDDAGREWVLRLDYTLVRQIRKTLGIDLIDLKGQGEAFAKMSERIELLVDTVYLAVKPQCEARGLTDEDFGRGLADGETFQRARLALVEAIVNFTPPPDRQASLAIQSMLMGARSEAVSQATQKMVLASGA